MILAPSGASTTISSMRAAEIPSVAGQNVSTANTMPALSSYGSMNEFSLEINGRTVNETEMKHGAKLMFRVIQPYLVK